MSKPQWLPHQQAPVVFQQVKFDIRGGFPFSLFEHHHTMKPEVGDLNKKCKSHNYRTTRRGLSSVSVTGSTSPCKHAHMARRPSHGAIAWLCTISPGHDVPLQNDMAMAVYRDTTDQIKAFHGLGQPPAVTSFRFTPLNPAPTSHHMVQLCRMMWPWQCTGI